MSIDNTYVVVQKIWTSAQLYEALELEGVRLFPNVPNDVTRERSSWVALRSLQAPSWEAAFSEASQHLMGLIDRLHVVTQCVFSLVGASWFLWSAEGGAPRTLIANQFRPRAVVPIALYQAKQLADTERLKAAKASSLMYFREAGRASTAKTKLAMLVIASEALAGSQGKSSKCNRCQSELLCPKCQCKNSYRATNMKAVENVFGEDLYKALYRNPENVRNRLMHGEFVPEQRASELATAAYAAFRKYLQSACGLESEINIVNAPRPLDGVTLHVVCLRARADWLPKVKDVPTADWLRVFNELESADLNYFGEHIDIPDGF